MGRSNRIVSQSMCNWLLLMVFVMQFVVYLLGKTVWGIFSSKPAELYYYIAVVEILAIALPMFLLCLFNGSGFGKTFALKTVKFSKLCSCLCIGICLQPVAVVGNTLWQRLLDINPSGVYYVLPTGLKEFGVVFLCLCVAPALCEEFLLRGMYLTAVRRKGYVFAVVTSTVMFVLLHSDVSMVVAHAILGVVTAVVVLNTNSVYSGILLHISFNLAGIGTDVLISKYNFLGSFGIYIAASVLGLFLTLLLMKRIRTKKSKNTGVKELVLNLLKAFFNFPILIIIIIYFYRIVG